MGTSTRIPGSEPDLSSVTELTGGAGGDLLQIQPSLRDRTLAWWLPRRIAAMVVLTPLILLALLPSAAASQSTFLLAVVSAGAALSLTSFVPAPGQGVGEVLRSPCATVGGVVPLACAASVLARPTSGSAVIALFFIALALVQRFSSASACSSPAR